MKRRKGFLPIAVFLLSVAMPLGAAWTTKRLTHNSGWSWFPNIAANASNVYAIWEDSTLGNFEIYFNRSTDKGATWQPIKRLTNTTGTSIYSAIAVGGSNVYVVWRDDTLENNEIYFRKSADNGETWQTAKRLTSNTGGSIQPAVAADGANVYVVWEDNTLGNPEIYFKKSADYGETWQGTKRLTKNAGSSYNPWIAVNGENIYVVWHDDAQGNFDIYFMKSADGGVNWQNAKRLSTNDGLSAGAKVAVRGDHVYVTWYDYTPGNPEIYFKKSEDGGANWQGTKRLTNNSGSSMYPRLAVYLANVYVVWTDETPGNKDVYFRNRATQVRPGRRSKTSQTARLNLNIRTSPSAAGKSTWSGRNTSRIIKRSR